MPAAEHLTRVLAATLEAQKLPSGYEIVLLIFAFALEGGVKRRSFRVYGWQASRTSSIERLSEAARGSRDR